MTRPMCSAEDGCSNVMFRNGLCRRHYTILKGKACSACMEPSYVGGLCTRHYTRKRRHGDIHATAFIRGDDEARFWSHVDRRGDYECWPWTSTRDKDGNGVIKVGGVTLMAYRWAYEHFVGPVPERMTVVRSKVCTRKNCMNFLAHMEVVRKTR